MFQSYGTGTGPIYLSQLNCDGSEATLLDCATFAKATGIHNCDHTDDVGVHCEGNKFCNFLTQNSFAVSEKCKNASNLLGHTFSLTNIGSTI